jgi:hypothetical protein
MLARGTPVPKIGAGVLISGPGGRNAPAISADRRFLPGLFFF